MTSAGIAGFSLHDLSLSSWWVLIYLNDGGRVPRKYGHRKGLSKSRLTSGISSLWPLCISQSKSYGQPRFHGKGHRLQFLKEELQGHVISGVDTGRRQIGAIFCIQLPATVDFLSFLIVKIKVNQKRFTRYSCEQSTLLVTDRIPFGRNLKSQIGHKKVKVKHS